MFFASYERMRDAVTAGIGRAMDSYIGSRHYEVKKTAKAILFTGRNHVINIPPKVEASLLIDNGIPTLADSSQKELHRIMVERTYQIVEHRFKEWNVFTGLDNDKLIYQETTAHEDREYIEK
jgi:hypothetical protein